MWPMCTANPFWWLLLPLLIGLLTGWWAWSRRPKMAYEAPAARPVSVAPTPPPAPAPVALAAVAPAPRPAPVIEPVVAPVAAAPAPIVEAPAPVAVVPVVVAPAVPAVAAVAATALGIPASVGAPDDLLQLKGVGPKLNALLNSLGVYRFDQIAAWTAGDVAKVDGHLGSFKGRIDRDAWVEQAGLLATGAIAAFEAKFGKLDSENQ